MIRARKSSRVPVKRKKPKRSTLTKKADALASKVVRARGLCELKQLGGQGSRCAGALQCCHIIGRRYRSTRWDMDNLLAGCMGHHVYWTHRPEGFVLAVQKVFPGLYEDLWNRAQSQWDKDLGAVLDSLSVLQGLHQEEK